MNTYTIYDMVTDEEIGTVRAISIIESEKEACAIWDMASTDLYALKEEED